MELNPKNNVLPLTASDSNDHQKRQYSTPKVVTVQFKVEVGHEGSVAPHQTSGTNHWQVDPNMSNDGTESWTSNGNFF